MSKNYFLGLGAVALAAVTLTGPAHAAPLGYGSFVGTWTTKSPSPYAQPTTGQNGPGNILEWGNNVLAVTDPDPFLITDWHLAGDTAGTWSNTTGAITSTGAMQFYSGGSKNGSWAYLGGAADAGGPVAVVDMYIALKYGTWVSVFYWSNVVAGDTGQFTIDPAVWNAAQSSPDLYTGKLGYGNKPATFFDGNCGIEEPNNIYFSYNCLGSPGGMSHAIAYWPPGDNVTEVPAPGTLALLGLGLFGFGAVLRRRRA